MTRPGEHTPVLLDEVLAAVRPSQGGIYVDGTFGRGGYSRAFLEACQTCRVLALDRDPDAVEAGHLLENQYLERFQIVAANFSKLEEVARRVGLSHVDGVTLDIGVSSSQLDEAVRGFSFRYDAPLDMRMSKAGLSSADVVNTFAEEDLSDIIYLYGEERAARRIARAIVEQRAVADIETTGQLALLVEQIVGASRRSRRVHPATKTFQALRAFVNDELFELAYGLSAAERLLRQGGCLAVVTFHSLEDRIVKRFFGVRSRTSAPVSRHMPPADRTEDVTFHIKQKRAVKPSAEEISANPRARSAKLRAGYRTAAAARPLDLGELGLTGFPRKEAA